ncbi:DinB family protein [Adhaeribacter swui]|uniref:DinB family protein n=1 Tax=Adhaeribacter swui TaxID=2086471 RepID=A0A7G7GEL7_9BACT|nr:DinB family protein [Adhaeribacter swui]QNF35601.1 DinB family protein [Adhaeribacter swui]
MNPDQIVRDQLVKLMQGGQAFTPMPELLQGITAEEAGTAIPELPYTLWQLIEHLRIALYDILEFSRDPNYQSAEWPVGYWPQETKPANQAVLDESMKTIQQGIAQMIHLVQDQTNDLYQPFAHGNGQNLLREAMLVAEHNAYHLGQILILRRLLGTWK